MPTTALGVRSVIGAESGQTTAMFFCPRQRTASRLDRCNGCPKHPRHHRRGEGISSHAAELVLRDVHRHPLSVSGICMPSFCRSAPSASKACCSCSCPPPPPTPDTQPDLGVNN
eukprot:15441354-Alexandrium_andersonii.AAC.1